jgi:hypothetical protein
MEVHLSATSANTGMFLVFASSGPGTPFDAVKVTVNAT